MSYAVVDVSSWAVLALEPGGDDDKRWLADPDGLTAWLFKPRVERDGRVQGEDWAEKISAELCHLLAVPAAQIELARRGDQRGLISRDLRPGVGWALDAGAVLLGGEPGFVVKSKARLGHRLDVIDRVLDPFGPPPGVDAGLEAFGVFAGFCVLDALIANPDRHEQNWAVLTAPDGALFLAPSFDHGSALAYNRLDDYRERLLETGEVGAFAARGRAQRFEAGPGGEVPTLVEHAADALRRAGDAARNHWLTRVEALRTEDVEGICQSVPELSDISRRFIVELVTINRGRLLDVC